jgi:hypothetical protein
LIPVVEKSGTRWRIPAAAPRVTIPGRGTIIQRALHENARAFLIPVVEKSGTRWRIPAAAPRVTIPGRGTIIKALAEMRGLF